MMNVEDLLHPEQSTLVQHAAQAHGFVFVIRCMPDPFTGELLNVGVCAVNADGTRAVKVIDEPGRLKCLYGDGAHAVVNLAQAAKEAALNGWPAPSTQLQFDDPTPFYNSTAEQVLAETFADQVTVALPFRDQARAKIVDDDEALARVKRILRAKLELEADMMMPDPFLMIQGVDGAKARTVHIPLRPAHGYGVVRSSEYGDATFRIHLHESALDLRFAGHARMAKLHKLNSAIAEPGLAIFIYMNPEAPTSHRKAADRALTDMADRWVGTVEFQPALGERDLAQQILTWRSQHNTPPEMSIH